MNQVLYIQDKLILKHTDNRLIMIIDIKEFEETLLVDTKKIIALLSELLGRVDSILEVTHKTSTEIYKSGDATEIIRLNKDIQHGILLSLNNMLNCFLQKDLSANFRGDKMFSEIIQMNLAIAKKYKIFDGMEPKKQKPSRFVN